MKIITNTGKIIPRLKLHLKKYGYRPEHHLQLFLYDIDPGYELTYFDFGNDGGIAAQRKGKRWYVIEEPIAPPQKRIDLLLRVLKHIFAHDSLYTRVTVEDWTEELKNKCAEALRKLPYRMLRPNTVQYWPVIDLQKFDAALSSGKMKGLRYTRNRFLKNHTIEICDARKVPPDQLMRLLEEWKKMRTAKDKVWAPDYEKFIQNGFPGCEIRRAFSIDGTFSGLSAGWEIPNPAPLAEGAGCYIYLDIHDYSDPYLGEFISLDYILEAKKAGFAYLDFGGSDKPLLNFKKKFHPEHIYKTCDFFILSPIL